MNQQSDVLLPPLPSPRSYDADQQEGWWTVDQMRAYALAACADLEVKVERLKRFEATYTEYAQTLVANAVAQRDEKIMELSQAWRDLNTECLLHHQRAEAAEGAAHAAISHRERTEGELAQERAARIAAEAEVLRLRTGFQTATVDLVAAEARIKELQQSAEVAARNMRDLVAEHVRERDALSERVRDLENVLRLKTFPEPYRIRAVIARGAQHDMALPIIEVLAEYPDMAVIVGTAGLTDEVAALRARLEAIQKQPTRAYFMYEPGSSSPGWVSDSPAFGTQANCKELIERPDLS